MAMSRQHFIYVLIGVAVVQVAMLAVTLPVAALVAGKTFWYIDHPYQQYQIALGRALAAQGLLVGYDPFFAGGYLGGVSFNASGKLPVLLAQVLPNSVSTGSLYNAYVIGCSVIAPLMVAWFVRLRRWPTRESLMACIAALLLWWCSAFRWYDTAGMVSFVFCSYLGVAFAAWIWRLSTSTAVARSWQPVFAGMVGGLACWLHPLFPIVVVFVFAGFLCIERRLIAWKSLGLTVLCLSIVVIVLNAPWMVSMFEAPNLVAEQPYQRAFGWTLFWQPLLNPMWPMGSFLYPLSIGLCVFGLLFLPFRLSAEVRPLVLGGLTMLAFSAFGGTVSAIGALQPNRFVAPAFLLFGLGGSYVAPAILARIQTSSRIGVRALAMLGAVAIALYSGRELFRECGPGQHGRHGKAPPELTAAPAIVQQLADWISTNTTDDARILFETSLGRVYGGGHVAGMLALMTQREMVGGPYPFMQPAQSFWDRVGFGRPLESLSDATFRTGLDDLNVGWIIAHSAGLQKRVEASGLARVVVTFGVVKIYMLDRPHSFADAGEVLSVRRAFNRIEIDTREGKDLVLRYNWVPGLKVTPPATIEPITVHPGFPPLIHVIHPPAHFVLSTCEQCLR